MSRETASQYGNHKPLSPSLEAFLDWRAKKGDKPESLRWKIWEKAVIFEFAQQQAWEAFRAGFEDGHTQGYTLGNQVGYDSGFEDAEHAF